MATRGSYIYVHSSMDEFSGASQKMLVLRNFLRKFMVSDKEIHRAFKTPTTL